MAELREPGKLGTTETAIDNTSKSSLQALKLVVLADLNDDPPEMDVSDSLQALPSDLLRLMVDETSQDKSTLSSRESDPIEGEDKRPNKLGRSRSRATKSESPLDCGADAADGDLPAQGAPSSREERVSSLKTALVQVARKMHRNAHAHFILGLMYQRLGQASKAILAYEKATEILQRPEMEIDRPELLSLVLIHRAQCLLLDSLGDSSEDKELEPEELEEILSKLKESIQSDIRQSAVWNTLGLILLRTGRLQSAISVFSSLLAITPDNYDCLGNLGIAYLQSGNLEQSEKCFQELLLKDQNHPAALINYAALLLCKHGSFVAGAGANVGDYASVEKMTAVSVAKECLLASLKTDPRASHLWANLANAYYIIGDHKSSSKCLEKAAKLEPNCMSTRYAVAVHRVKDAERCQDPSEQLSWAGNEMASIIRDGDTATQIESPIAWAGLAMAHKAHHEIATAFDTEQNVLVEVEERAVHSLKQAITEDPDDPVQLHQIGLHSLCTQQFKNSQKYFKATIARFNDCSYAWSNLGIALHLSSELSQAEEVYKKALSLATTDHSHAIYSNLGNLYRHQKKYERAKAMFTKSLQLRPGYAPAYNNLGLVFVAEGQWEEAKFCFERALQEDPLLDAAKSNVVKAMTMSNSRGGLS